MILTGNDVWEAILTDPQFIPQIPEGNSPQRAAIRPYIEGSVRALGDQLDTIVTLQSYAKARASYLRFCVENDYGEVMRGVGWTVPKGMFKYLSEMYESIAEDTTEFLEDNCMTEEEVMLSQIIELNPDNQLKYREGTLTIGELLLTQPTVIIRDS